MIKSVRNESEVESAYPKIMKSNNLVVLFSSHKKGVVIGSTSLYDVGHISEDWAMDCFDNFVGSITLSNEG